jgi:hypothetical protein
MILVATRVLAVAADWLTFSRFLSLRSFAAIVSAGFLGSTRSLTGASPQQITTTADQPAIANHLSLLPGLLPIGLASEAALHGRPLTNHSGRFV